MIHMRDVSKIYENGAVALDHVNVDIEAGDFVFIVGASGAGKSTFIKMLFREELPSSGSLFVNGRDVVHMKRSEVPYLRRGLGVIFQDYRLLPDKTVFENVAFAMQVIEAPRRLMQRNVNAVLDVVGLRDKFRCFPSQLSGGEQQRVAIARAIVNDPAIVIADEPTGNLDPETSWDIMDIFNRINLAGTTIVMATHDKTIVDTMQRRVIAIEDGYRESTESWLAVLRDLKVRVDELAKRYVDRMRDIGPECDFVEEIAVNFPLYVILSLLGLPEDDFPRMLKLTQEMFGGQDEEHQRGGTPEDMLAVLMDFFNYFSALTASRRETPTQDLASAIANAKINGEPLSDMDTLSYYVITASAGHDTTSAGMAGGMLALTLLGARSLAKLFGVLLLTRPAGASWRQGLLLGLALSPAAGPAMVAAADIGRLYPELQQSLVPISMSAAAIMELMGPMIVALCLKWSGERREQ